MTAERARLLFEHPPLDMGSFEMTTDLLVCRAWLIATQRNAFRYHGHSSAELLCFWNRLMKAPARWSASAHAGSDYRIAK